jgi:uncharacterized protein YjbI with pentapeptide repeats
MKIDNGTRRLRRRWSQKDVDRINVAMANRSLEKLALNTLDDDGQNLRDLRGFPIEEIVTGLSAERLDLSGCHFKGAGQFLECCFSICRFAKADISTNLGHDFVKCDFSKALLTTVYGRFADCAFPAANLRRIFGVGVSFIRCDFDSANFHGAFLKKCTFERCNWENARFGCTSFAQSTFIGTQPKIDEEPNVLEGVMFKRT